LLQVGICIVSLAGEQLDNDDAPWQLHRTHSWFLHLVVSPRLRMRRPAAAGQAGTGEVGPGASTRQLSRAAG
jgi:hypothetical protein